MTVGKEEVQRCYPGNGHQGAFQLLCALSHLCSLRHFQSISIPVFLSILAMDL